MMRAGLITSVPFEIVATPLAVSRESDVNLVGDIGG
jgi:hypothetical protein